MVGSDFFVAVFGGGNSVCFLISLCLPKKCDVSSPLEAFPLGLAPEKNTFVYRMLGSFCLCTGGGGFGCFCIACSLLSF